MAKNVKKSVPKSINEISKEKLEEILLKKKKCNTTAHKIVEALCEMHIDENWFLNNLQFINQSHFEDVVIERAILKLCGYPLCNNKIEKLMHQQYHISTRYNKVFDITERKNFCSNACYKAATFVKNQLFTSPLWFRDQEVIPKYTILKTNKSSLGEEVIFFPDKIIPEKDDFKPQNLETQKTEKNFEDHKVINNNLIKLSENQSQKELIKVKSVYERNSTNNISETIKNSDLKSLKNTLENNEILPNNKLLLPKTDLKEEKTIENKSNDSKNTVTKNNDGICKNLEKENQVSSSMEPKNIVKESEKTNKISNSNKVAENAIFEWISLDTLFLLFGEKQIKKLLNDSNGQIKEALNSKLKCTASYNDEIEKLIKLYELLDLETSTNASSKPTLKPLPDYTAIQEESKTLDIKVKAFYNGSLEINNSLLEKSKATNDEANEVNVCLPLIDSHAQNSLRRKILLDKLGKVLPKLIQIFNKEYILEASDIKKIVSTFVLSAHNITFKPVEWTLIGLILMKLLSVKNKHLDDILNWPSSQKQMELLLSSFNLEANYLNSFVDNLMNSEVILKKLS